VQLNDINKFVLDIVIGLFGNDERRPRNTWVTEQVINQGWAKEVEECYQRRRRKNYRKPRKFL